MFFPSPFPNLLLPLHYNTSPQCTEAAGKAHGGRYKNNQKDVFVLLAV